MRYPIRLYLVGVILPTVAIALVALVASVAGACGTGGVSSPTHPNFHGPHYAASQVGAEVCFPFKDWGPASIDRAPCYTVPHPQEDGSGIIYLGTVSNDAAECLIPNPFEERGTFHVTCRRIGGRNE